VFVSEIAGVTVDWNVSPRIIKIPLGTLEVTAQDLLDTCRAIESAIDALDNLRLVDSVEGETALDDVGTQTTITLTLLNAQVYFTPDNVPVSTGTATANASTVGGRITLTDGVATFQTDGVARGDTVYNAASGALATIVTIGSETTLTALPLTGGSRADWQIGDAYRVWNNERGTISGGNVVAVDDEDLRNFLDPVLEGPNVQVVRASASSGTIGIAEGQTPAAVAEAVWDELLTGATHNINQSAGKILRGLGNLVVLTDTAQGPGTGNNQIQLHAGASAVDGSYDPAVVAIVDGTGAGQSRLILQYEGATKCATVDRNWKVNPDNTSEFVIYADAGREHVNEGLAQGGTATTITLNALASSVDDVYLYQTVFVRSGTGEDQVGIVIAYDGTTTVATIDGGWAVIPDTTSGYVMLPRHNNVSVEQFSAYHGRIVIDVANGSAGVRYPVGTLRDPVDNLADAKTLGALYGIETFHVQGTLVIGASDVIDDLVFEAHNELTDTVALTAGASTVNTVFRQMRLTGTVGGAVFCDRCALSALVGIGSDTDPSLFSECILLEGTTAFRSGLTTPQNVQLVNCVSGVTSGTGTTLDFNGTTSRVALRKYGGAIAITNYTGGQVSTFEFSQGAIDFDATNTAGTATLRGGYSLTDASGGGFTIVQDAPPDAAAAAAAVWSSDLSTYTTSGTAGIILRKAFAVVKGLLGLV
jgi:hypothetical protein